jgi:hypothetical protein
MPERVEVESIQWTTGLPEDRARRLLVLLFRDFGVLPAEEHPDNGNSRRRPGGAQRGEMPSRGSGGGSRGGP